MKKEQIITMALVLVSCASCSEVKQSETEPVQTSTVLYTQALNEIASSYTEEVITSQPETETRYEIESEPAIEYDNSDEIKFLADLINKEASTTWAGKLMVGSCVVNRMSYFNTDVYGVVYMPNQFTTAYILDGYYTDLDYQAAEYVINVGTYNPDIFFFHSAYDGTNTFLDVNYNCIGNF